MHSDFSDLDNLVSQKWMVINKTDPDLVIRNNYVVCTCMGYFQMLIVQSHSDGIWYISDFAKFPTTFVSQKSLAVE